MSVGTPSEDSELVDLVTEPADVEVAAGGGRPAGGHRRHRRARATWPLEAHLISPWGTWEWIGPAACRARCCRPARHVELGFDVAPPPWVQPGEWWALIRVGCAGRLLYSPAVKVTVR